jgi:hypothetical protein
MIHDGDSEDPTLDVDREPGPWQKDQPELECNAFTVAASESAVTWWSAPAH